MDNNVINKEIIFNYPDGFKQMDNDELDKYFGTTKNMFGIRCADKNMIMSIGWSKMNILVKLFANPGAVINGMDARLRSNLEDFEITSEISTDICGVNALGFSFEYTAHDDDIEQIGNVVAFKLRKALYVVQFLARKENEEKAQKVFNDIISSLSLKEH